MSDLAKILGRSVLFGAMGFATGPLAPFAVLFSKVLEDLWSDQEQATLAARIAALEAALGKDPAAVRDHLNGLLRIIAAHAPPTQLRHAESCMAVIRALNTRSEHAVYWDPRLEEEDLIEILHDVSGVEDPATEIDLVIHELTRFDLIKAPRRNVILIGPSDDFFARTDPLFQPWNPRVDARMLCHHARMGDDRIHLRPLDQELGWGARRMNPAIVYLRSNGYADNFEGMMNGEYIDHAVMLTTAARFFEEEEPLPLGIV